MKQNEKQSIFGFSVLDVILFVLIAVSILSYAFREPIRDFLSGEQGVEIEYTFLIENASPEAKNMPLRSEVLTLSEDGSELGVLVQVAQTEKIYADREDPEDQIRIKTLTCKARATAKETERGYLLGGRSIKPGAEFSIVTDSASFTMVVTMVKNISQN